MADNKKYYYIRLNENFFETETITLLEAMPDGYLYSNILMKLMLRSLKSDGRLMYNNKIPYSAQMLATITKHQVGTIEKALTIFENMGLIDILDNGAIYMLDIQNFIGKTSTEADRKRVSDRKIAEEKSLINGAIGEMSEKCVPELELELELEIEKELDIELKKDIEKKKKHKHGEYSHVLLTDDELAKLQADYPNCDELIIFLDEYIEMKGYKAKSHYLAIKKWVVAAVNERKPKQTSNQAFLDKWKDA